MLSEDKLRELEKEFHEVKKKLTAISEKYKVKTVLLKRRKDFVGINEKTRLYLEDNRPLSKLQDLLGFRVVLCTKRMDDKKSVELCYEILNELILFFVVKRGCILAEAEPVIITGIDLKEHPDVVIPKENLVLSGFENNVKDYIRYPKKNGYQSVHTIIQKPDGLVFEIQVRTMAMDIRAEFGSANHGPYKKDRYEGTTIDIDLSKVNIQGFAIMENGELYDKIGLCKSVDPFNLL